jgi:PPOX class probable F420-dependent enzyme
MRATQCGSTRSATCATQNIVTRDVLENGQLLECWFMVAIPNSARSLLLSGRLAHLVTINPDGSPQISIVWVGLDGDEIVLGHLGAGQKMRNIERDPRVALSVEGTEVEPPGLQQYLLVHGRARVTQGGGPELLQALAHVYLGPDVKFPAFDNPPPGRVMHISVERIGGVGPWAHGD